MTDAIARWDVTGSDFDHRKLAEWRAANPDTPIVIVAADGTEHTSRSAETDDMARAKKPKAEKAPEPTDAEKDEAVRTAAKAAAADLRAGIVR